MTQTDNRIGMAASLNAPVTVNVATVPNRRWFQYSLWMLFVVVTVFSCWLGSLLHWKQQRHAIAIHQREELRIHVYVGPGTDTRPPWPLAMLGAPGYLLANVMVDDHAHPTADDEQRARLAQSLFPEAAVEFAEECKGVRLITPHSLSETR